MTCDSFRRDLLELGWAEAERDRAAKLLAHLDACEACREAAGDFDRLRAVLKPAEAEVEPSGGWSAFEERLIGGLRPARWRGWPMPAALAASLLLAVIGWGLYLQPKTPTGTSVDRDTASIDFTPQEVAQAVQVFDRVSQVFDRQTSWVLLSDRSSDLGLVARPLPADRKVLLLRLVVLRGDRVVSHADLAIVAGQAANLTVPFESGQQLRYHVSTSADTPTRLAIWVEVEQTHEHGETLASLATDLHVGPGRVLSAGRLVTSSGGYDLKVGFSRADLREHQG